MNLKLLCFLTLIGIGLSSSFAQGEMTASQSSKFIKAMAIPPERDGIIWATKGGKFYTLTDEKFERVSFDFFKERPENFVGVTSNNIGFLNLVLLSRFAFLKNYVLYFSEGDSIFLLDSSKMEWMKVYTKEGRIQTPIPLKTYGQKECEKLDKGKSVNDSHPSLGKFWNNHTLKIGILSGINDISYKRKNAATKVDLASKLPYGTLFEWGWKFNDQNRLFYQGGFYNKNYDRPSNSLYSDFSSFSLYSRLGIDQKVSDIFLLTLTIGVEQRSFIYQNPSNFSITTINLPITDIEGKLQFKIYDSKDWISHLGIGAGYLLSSKQTNFDVENGKSFSGIGVLEYKLHPFSFELTGIYKKIDQNTSLSEDSLTDIRLTLSFKVENF